VTTSSPDHLSIGDVLGELRGDFPDITISKIRFLESQGLIDPERTPSGYRKFYGSDVERLRWILHQQRDHFLPLKVIKERLDGLEPGGDLSTLSGPETASPESGAPRSDAGAPRPPATNDGARATPVVDAPVLDAQVVDAPIDEPVAPEEATPAVRSLSSGASLNRGELARAAGLEDAQLAQLESYGLISPVVDSGDHVLFDEEALGIARAAAGFYRHGIEARHLRMYKHFAEREASLFGQVLVPHLRQRNPEARARAQAQLAELARLGRALRAALLVGAVRESLGE
jgi:DNA-binding transcriptional MerR regulator